jgi:LPS sulfotransferase NodH
VKRDARWNGDDDRGPPSSSAYEVRKAELFYYVRGLDPRAPRARLFVVYSHYRTGSHLLAGLLNGHPRVSCGGEVLVGFMRPKLRRVVLPKLLLRGCVRNAPPGVEVYGLRLKSDQLISLMPRHDPAGLLRWLDGNGAQIIYLYRKNVVRQAISDVVANARLRWSAPADSVASDARVVIDPTSLIGTIRWFEHTRDLEQRALEGIPRLTLSYENDLFDTPAQHATMQRTFAFLGVEPIAVTADDA